MKGVIAICAVAATMGCAAMASAQHLERNSFVRKPISDRATLLQQYDTDPVLRARYVKHFQADEGAVRDMFSGLNTTELSKSGRYLVYNYQPDGTIGLRRLFYHKGEKVLIDAAGRPVLRIACGNPMISAIAIPDAPTFSSKNPVDPPLFGEEVPLTPIETVEPGDPLPTEPLALVPSSEAPLAFAPAPQLPIAGGGGFNALPLLGLAAVGTGLALIPGGGENSVTPLAPVPEPASMAVLGLGFGTMMFKRRRAKK